MHQPMSTAQGSSNGERQSSSMQFCSYTPFVVRFFQLDIFFMKFKTFSGVFFVVWKGLMVRLHRLYMFLIPVLSTNKQQQQHSFLSQVSWGRLQMKPKRYKCHGSGTLIASLQALLSKTTSSIINPFDHKRTRLRIQFWSNFQSTFSIFMKKQIENMNHCSYKSSSNALS